MADQPLYDTIGVGYAAARRPDPRVGAQIHDALGDARTVLNIGAGTGNYEPTDRPVVAVEPAAEMLRQRANRRGVAQGVAEAIPLADNAVDCAMGTFTVHHWPDRDAGLRELARVSDRQVLLVYDTACTNEFWLTQYFPDVVTAPWEINAPTAHDIGQVLDVTEVRTLWVPRDCTDGFTAAYWHRPEAYLDLDVQAGMSTLARLNDQARARGTAALADAIQSGQWQRDHGHLLQQDRFDIGYRLVISTSPR